MQQIRFLPSYDSTSFKLKAMKLSYGRPIIQIESQNKTYDFGISTAKFERTFNFKFTDTLDSITQDMVTQYAKCNRAHRADLVHYT